MRQRTEIKGIDPTRIRPTQNELIPREIGKGLSASHIRGTSGKVIRARNWIIPTSVAAILLVGLFVAVMTSGQPPQIRMGWTSAQSNQLWNSEGNQNYANYGLSVSSAGDTNSDGYEDIVIGSCDYTNGEYREGRAYLYCGSSTGLSTLPSWTAESNQASSRFGWSVAGAGDVDDDGGDDVIVGAYGYSNGQASEGRAFLYQSSVFGLRPTPSWVAESNQEYSYFGCSVASAGDVNGDGYDDVVVGAKLYDNGEVDEGRAFLYLGSSSGLSTSPSWTAEVNQAYAHFGACVASAGDVNNDGYDDVVVGADAYDNDQTNEGGVFLYLGSDSGLASSASMTAESDQAEAYFGYSVASAGDLNRDGYDDLVVGAPWYEAGEPNEGRIYVYYGSPTGPNPGGFWVMDGNQAQALFGYSVASAGDVNNDGFDDIIVGASDYSDGETAEGRAFVCLGSPSGLTGSDWTVESDQAYARLGTCVSSAGDINNDGFDELLVGAPTFDNGQEDEGRTYCYGAILIPEFPMLIVPVLGAIGLVFATTAVIKMRRDS